MASNQSGTVVADAIAPAVPPTAPFDETTLMTWVPKQRETVAAVVVEPAPQSGYPYAAVAEPAPVDPGELLRARIVDHVRAVRAAAEHARAEAEAARAEAQAAAERERLAFEAAAEQERAAQERERVAAEQERAAREAAAERAALDAEAERERAAFAAAEQAKEAAARKVREAAARKLAEETARREAEKSAVAAAALRAEEERLAVLAVSYVKPVASCTMSGGFGSGGSPWAVGNFGQDFAVPTGTPAVAVHSGTITAAGWAGAHGYRIVLTLDDGTQLWYCNLSSMVKTSGRVCTGDVIGRAGATGNASAASLHLEVRPSGVGPVDPVGWLRERGVAV